MSERHDISVYTNPDQCGCKVTGDGGEGDPLTVERCNMHEAAEEMNEALKQIESLADNSSDHELSLQTISTKAFTAQI